MTLPEDPAPRVDAYEMTSDMERAIVAVLLDPKQGAGVLAKIADHARGDAFTDETVRRIVVSAAVHYRKFRCAPTATELLQQVPSNKDAAATRAAMASVIEEAREAPRVSPDFVVELILAAERKRALWGALERSTKLFVAGKLDEVFVEIDKARSVGRSAVNARRTPAERARALGTRATKYTTGFGALDHATRGGFRSGGLVVLGGAPGAAKTTVATQLALRWARAGHRVTFLAADEGADGILTRMGQSIDLPRDELEGGAAAARERLASLLEQEAPWFSLLDAHEEEDASLDDVIEGLLAEAAGGPAILIVDSIQAARVDDDPEADGPRARVDAVMRALRSGARRGLLIVATSELARGAYRSRDAADRIDDLAAFKESGGVEYGADLAIVLRSTPGDGVTFKATIAKTRWGDRDEFQLVLDRTTATLVEVDVPAPQKASRPDVGERVAAAIELVRGELRAKPGRHGKRTMRQALRGKALQDDVDDAIATLLQADEIVATGPNKNKPQWRLVEKQEGGPNAVLPS